MILITILSAVNSKSNYSQPKLGSPTKSSPSSAVNPMNIWQSLVERTWSWMSKSPTNCSSTEGNLMEVTEISFTELWLKTSNISSRFPWISISESYQGQLREKRFFLPRSTRSSPSTSRPKRSPLFTSLRKHWTDNLNSSSWTMTRAFLWRPLKKTVST